MAQQVSTAFACQLADRVKSKFPMFVTRSREVATFDVARLREIGLSARRAQCCLDVAQRADNILCSIREGSTWEEALAGIKGIGPWTVAVFRIMVLRMPDEFPIDDVGLLRAIQNTYGENADLKRLSDMWQPYRSVACWYLWRTLGNQQLG